MNSKSTNRTGVIALMLSRVFLFGCALALATNVSTREVLAQPSVQICKQTTPSPDLTNQVFNFTGAPTAFHPEWPTFMYFASKPASRNAIAVRQPTWKP